MANNSSADAGVPAGSTTPRRAVTRGAATAGSRFRIQQYVHAHRGALDAELRKSPTLDSYLAADPDWRSPIAERDFLEFRDDLWTELRLAVPTPKAAGFWPAGGPQWDAVASLTGRDGTVGVLLVEAKARRGEDRSEIDRKTKTTLEQRLATMASVRHDLGARVDADWSKPYYQLANRLTFLHYLRVQHRVPAWLGLIYFTGDIAGSPASPDDWRPEIDRSFAALGLASGHGLADWLIEVILPAQEEPTARDLAIAVPRQMRCATTDYWARA